jgi:hypothetical protein
MKSLQQGDTACGKQKVNPKKITVRQRHPSRTAEFGKLAPRQAFKQAFKAGVLIVFVPSRLAAVGCATTEIAVQTEYLRASSLLSPACAKTRCETAKLAQASQAVCASQATIVMAAT